MLFPTLPKQQVDEASSIGFLMNILHFVRQDNTKCGTDVVCVMVCVKFVSEIMVESGKKRKFLTHTK